MTALSYCDDNINQYTIKIANPNQNLRLSSIFIVSDNQLTAIPTRMVSRKLNI